MGDDHNGFKRLLADHAAALRRYFAPHIELARRVRELEEKQRTQAQMLADLQARLEQLEEPKH
jgi:hypothetical protein